MTHGIFCVILETLLNILLPEIHNLLIRLKGMREGIVRKVWVQGISPFPILNSILVIHPKEMRTCINCSALIRLLQKLCWVLTKGKVSEQDANEKQMKTEVMNSMRINTPVALCVKVSLFSTPNTFILCRVPIIRWIAVTWAFESWGCTY